MKFRIKTEDFMEDFIADEEDRELARVAFRRAKRVLKRRYLLIALLLLGIGSPFVLLAPLPFSLKMAVIWGTIAAISIPAFCRYDRIFSEEYHKQLDELKLEMRGRKEHMEMHKVNAINFKTQNELEDFDKRLTHFLTKDEEVCKIYDKVELWNDALNLLIHRLAEWQPSIKLVPLEVMWNFAETCMALGFFIGRKEYELEALVNGMKAKYGTKVRPFIFYPEK